MSNDLDIRYCDAECGKACARNKKKRVIFASGRNLQDIKCGRCVNYLPIFKLSKEEKKLFKLVMP